MFRRLQTAADIALGAAVSGWRRVRHRAEDYAETGRASRGRLGDRVERETETWRESGREQLSAAEERVREELERAFRRAHLVPRSEQEALNRELRRLQARLANLEAQVDKQQGEGGDAGR